MMVSSENFIADLKNKSYKELLEIRDDLNRELVNFENTNIPQSEYQISPSPDVVYQCNLEYLSRLCLLIAEKFRSEMRGNNEICEKKHYLLILRDYLIVNVPDYDSSDSKSIIKRKQGQTFSLSEHIKGMIYSQLSSQRKWKQVELCLTEIDNVFFNYNVDKLKITPGSVFNAEIENLKCGNMSFAKSMEGLHYNIAIFEKIEKEYGSVDAFVTSDLPTEIVKKLSSYTSKYKLKQIGPALAWEYLRNVGIDGAKPDDHLRRFLGADRMGKGYNSPASIGEILEQVDALATETGLSKTAIDKIIWYFCSAGYGEVCSKTPNCHKCPIRRLCRMG